MNSEFLPFVGLLLAGWLGTGALGERTAYAECSNDRIGYGACQEDPGGHCTAGSWQFNGVATDGPTFCTSGTYVPLDFDAEGDQVTAFKCMQLDCVGACGDGQCDAYLGETTSSCAADCRVSDQRVVGYGNCRENRYESELANDYGCGKTTYTCDEQACPYTWQLRGSAEPGETTGPCGSGETYVELEYFSNGDLAEYECRETIEAVCGDGTCSPSEDASGCYTDCGRCGDGTCSGPESDSSCYTDCGRCGDGACSGPETSSSCYTDCGRCGDGACNGGETSASCPRDCGPSCGNGRCETGESASSCYQDCGRCGDGRCDEPEESASSCYRDCGSCGDGACNGTEDASSCYEDCGSCGDGACNGTETANTCSEDCACDPDDSSCTDSTGGGDSSEDGESPGDRDAPRDGQSGGGDDSSTDPAGEEGSGNASGDDGSDSGPAAQHETGDAGVPRAGRPMEGPGLQGSGCHVASAESGTGLAPAMLVLFGWGLRRRRRGRR